MIVQRCSLDGQAAIGGTYSDKIFAINVLVQIVFNMFVLRERDFGDGLPFVVSHLKLK